MPQVQVPFLPIAEDTTFAELPEVLEFFIRHVGAQMGSQPPLYIFEPFPKWDPSQPPTVSEAPEDLVLVALDDAARGTCLAALAQAHAREPKFSAREFGESIPIDETTSLRAVLACMSTMPATIFSIKIPIDASQAISIFFLRTLPTVGEFRRAIG